MWIRTLRYVLLVSLLPGVFIDPRTFISGEQTKVAVVVEENERIAQNEAYFRVKGTNTFGIPVFSTGVNFDLRHRSLDIYLQ